LGGVGRRLGWAAHRRTNRMGNEGRPVSVERAYGLTTARRSQRLATSLGWLVAHNGFGLLCGFCSMGYVADGCRGMVRQSARYSFLRLSMVSRPDSSSLRSLVDFRIGASAVVCDFVVCDFFDFKMTDYPNSRSLEIGAIS